MTTPLKMPLRSFVATLVLLVASLSSGGVWAVPKEAPRKITDYSALVWQQSSGLPNNSLRAILQTRDRYLWIGTKGGLSRFNGTKFVTYSARTPGQLMDSEIRALVEGVDGSLYIGTMAGGLSILKDGKFTTLRQKEGLAHDVVRALCRGQDGSIWIGTDGGLNRLKDGKLKTFDKKAGLLTPAVRALSEDRKGRIWVGTPKGLFIIDGETVIDRSREDPVGNRLVTSVVMDLEGRLWVSTSDRSLFRSDGDSFAVMPPALTPGGDIKTMHVDSFGFVWLGTSDGVYRTRGGKLERYPRFVGSRSKTGYVNAIPVSDIWAIASDREGHIWLGAAEIGLIQLRSGRFQGISADDGLPSSWVHTVGESADGDLYVGTDRGLAMVRGDQVTPVSLGGGTDQCQVWGLARGGDGVVWVGSECGVFSGRRDHFARYPLPSQNEDRLHAMATTRDGNLWLGYDTSGLLRITPGGEARWFTTKDGLSSNQVRAIREIRDGTLLVGTLVGGLNQIKGDQITTLGASKNEAMEAIYYVLVASDAGLWFATRRGLVRRKDGRDSNSVLLPTGHDQPPVEFFYSLVEDSLGYVWLTSNVGIFRVSLADLNALADGQNKEVAVAWFTNEDGLPSPACAQTTPNSAIPCLGGRLCFATNGGVAIVDPKSALPSQYAPPVYIENVIFDRAPVDMKAGIVLGPGRNDIEFDYAGLEYAFPTRMHFRYRLDGWDPGWREPVIRRTAYYTNLSPGRYRFEVIASNSDGVWSNAGAVFAFEIAPRFYQTKLFYVLSAVLLLILVVVAFRMRTRVLRLRTVQLEETVRKRTEVIAQRNQDMRLVMDNVSQGFLTVDMKGKLALERSATVDRWFGSYPADTQYVAYMRGVDPAYADSFEVGLEALVDDFLPREVCIGQLPARIKRNNLEYRCVYTALLKEDRLDGLLVVISDVTAELLHTHQEAERKELLAMFEALTKDRTGFLSFFDEASELMNSLSEADVATQKSRLHTLKGNAGMVGFGIVASLCHQAEDVLHELGRALPVSSLDPLCQRWRQLSESLHSFLGDKARNVLELNVKEIEQLKKDILAGASQEDLLDCLASWELEATERPMERLVRYATGLAKRLGKGELEVEVLHHGVRLAPKAWSGFWSDLVHVIRNAVDHGLESADERKAVGKSESPRLRLETRVVGLMLVVAVEDDGRGIDWSGVKQAAIAMQLPHSTEPELVQAMFAEGCTTRSEITTVSGRGVGLAAVRKQVEHLGGSISVTSRPSEGTSFRFVFPLEQIGARFGIDPGDAPTAQAKA